MFAIRSLLRSFPQTGGASRSFFTPHITPQRAHFSSKSWPARLQSQTSPSTARWQTFRRRFHQSHTHRRQAFNYQRFTTTKNLLQRWAARPTFYYEIGGLSAAAGGVYILNLEEVPVSGRKRFNIISASLETQQGKNMYAQTMQEYRGKLMSPLSKEHRLVKRVLERLIPHAGVEGEWEIHVIDDDMQNAFVIPGGKVFVFRGILDVCGYDENGVAAVLGHEIAHNVAHHAAERMSQGALLIPIAIVGQIFGIDFGIVNFISNLAFTLPGSRGQESEADYIGLLMMAEACFDPTAAMRLWSKMEQEEKGKAPPEFMSTHPSSHGRLERIREWLPKAQERLEAGECGGGLAGYASAFKSEVVGREAKW